MTEDNLSESSEVSELNELEEFSLENNSSEDDLELDEDELELEEDIPEDLEIDEELELSLESEEDDLIATDTEELAIEDQIENAVSELTQEDLDSEVDEETLLDIAVSEIDSIDSLTSRDLKLAVGEEVEEIPDDSLSESSEVPELNELEEISVESNSTDIDEALVKNTEITPDNDGVEALKKLLKALTNEDVAASMKGMKISINITLGDN